MIEVRVRQLATGLELGSHVAARLTQKLLLMKHRTYLWLHLAIDDFRTTHQDSIRPENETIQLVPSFVEDAYERILSRVKQTRQDTVKTLLKIIVGARRPLSVGELALALGFAASIDPKTFEDVTIDLEQLKTRIRNWCGLFVFINHSKVYSIHQTAREFFLGRSAENHSSWTWKSSLSTTDVESTLMSICVRCLSLQESTRLLLDKETTQKRRCQGR